MYKQVEVKGKGGISAKILLDSISATTGENITTFELTYHRNVHSELMTHRVFSRNAASSRAIPFIKMKEQCTAMPIFYGKNQSGMQAYSPLDDDDAARSEQVIIDMRDAVLVGVKELVDIGNHKQTYNRYLEPYQMIKTVVTATSFDNWYWLRHHEAADPLIAELARCMWEANKQSCPHVLEEGEWHLPYVEFTRVDGELKYYITEGECLSVEDALKISAARCAAVSFRNCDYGLEKSREVWERLVGDARKHSSAMEHCAKVMNFKDGVNTPFNPATWQEGVSHVDREGNLWSGNFKGWIQLRKTIEGECCWNYNEAVGI